MMEEETHVMQPQAEGCQGLPAIAEARKKDTRTDSFSGPPEGTNIVNLLILGTVPSM